MVKNYFLLHMAEQLQQNRGERVKLRGISKFGVLFLLVLLVLAAALGWYMLSSGPEIRNVVLISIDTCRADHLSCYGFEKQTTPNIDKISQEAVLFTHAISPVPITLSAHSSMLTGTYPPYHKVHDNMNYKLDESNETLAEILRRRGYATGAVISSVVLYSRFGIGQGFDYYDETFVEPLGPRPDTERRGGEASHFANSFLEEHYNEKFFLFLHYYDPHVGYNPPEPYATTYADDLYSGEIAYTDQCVGEVITKLKELGLYDSTLLIIVGDHGEGLGEHGESEHTYYIYQTTMWVPFIIKPGGLSRPRRIDDTVSLVDVVPTILGYLDLPIPGHVQGEDLSGYSRGKKVLDDKRYVYGESLTPTKYGCNPLLGLIGKDWKYIETTRAELYNLKDDPSETYNLIKAESKRARLMREQLQDWTTQLVGAGTVDASYQLSEEDRKRLESLGYVGTSDMDDTLSFDPAKPDPKDRVAFNEYAQKIYFLIYVEKFSQARAICDKMVQEFPQLPATYFLLMRVTEAQDIPAETIKYGLEFLEMTAPEGTEDITTLEIDATKPMARTHDIIANAAYKLEKFDLALEHWNIALKLKPDWPEVLNMIANAYFKVGKLKEAVPHWKKALKIKPDWSEAHNNLASAYYKDGDLDLAIEHWSKAAEIKPNWPEVRKNLNAAIILQSQDKQIKQFAEMVENDPSDAEAHHKLAALYYRLGKLNRSVIHWRRAISIKPDWAEPQNNLAWVLATAQDAKLRNPSEALRLAQHACELTDSNDPGVLDTLGVAYAAAGKFSDAVLTAEKAVALALSSGKEDLAQEIQGRLELYQAQQPYR